MSAMRGKPPHGRLDKLVVDQRLVVTTGGGGRGRRRRRSQETREPCRGAIRAGRVGHAPAVMPTTASAGGATGATSTSMASGMVARALEFLGRAGSAPSLGASAAARSPPALQMTSHLVHDRTRLPCAAAHPLPVAECRPRKSREEQRSNTLQWSRPRRRGRALGPAARQVPTGGSIHPWGAAACRRPHSERAFRMPPWARAAQEDQVAAAAAAVVADRRPSRGVAAGRRGSLHRLSFMPCRRRRRRPRSSSRSPPQ